MLKLSPNDRKLKEYANQKELSTKTDNLLKSLSALVEKELGTEAEGVTFMPTLNVICRLKNDPTSEIDPISFSVVKRPTSSAQIHDIVNNILLKDPVFLASIMQGVATNLAEMMTIHFDMTSLVNSMGENFNEETEVTTDEDKGKNPESQSNASVEGSKKNSNEVN